MSSLFCWFRTPVSLRTQVMLPILCSISSCWCFSFSTNLSPMSRVAGRVVALSFLPCPLLACLLLVLQLLYQFVSNVKSCWQSGGTVLSSLSLVSLSLAATQKGSHSLSIAGGIITLHLVSHHVLHEAVRVKAVIIHLILLEQSLVHARGKFRIILRVIAGAGVVEHFLHHLLHHHFLHHFLHLAHDSDYDQSSWMEKMMKKMMMKKMMEKMFDHSSSSYDSEYDSEFSPSMYKRLFKKDQMDYDSFDSDSFMENMMRNKMKSDDSSSYRQRMAALLSRNKRQANKGQGRKDSATTLPATLDIGDKLVEKLKHQQEEMEHKIGNMTCVLRETGVLNQQNKLDIRTQKQYFQQFKFENKWLKNRIEKVME